MANKKVKSESKQNVYTVKNIKWDIDGLKPKLPKTIKVTIPDDVSGYDETEQYISDEISNITGWCHKGFDTIPEIPA